MPTYQPDTDISQIAGIWIYTSIYLGDRAPRRYAKKGPYQQRRQKRLDQAYGWTPERATIGTGLFIFGRGGIWCHPDDMETLRIAIATNNLDNLPQFGDTAR